MSNGRVPRKPTQQRSIESHEPVSATRARQLILDRRAWDGMRVLGHLNLHEESSLYSLPENLTCESLDISECANLTTLPQGLHVTHWVGWQWYYQPTCGTWVCLALARRAGERSHRL